MAPMFAIGLYMFYLVIAFVHTNTTDHSTSNYLLAIHKEHSLLCRTVPKEQVLRNTNSTCVCDRHVHETIVEADTSGCAAHI